jgi:hypothetical protein
VILAAALLVLLGAGLFVAGLLTGVSILYWACVAACVVAAVLLIAARRSMTPAGSAPEATGQVRAETAPTVVAAPVGEPAAAQATAPAAAPQTATEAEPVSATGATAVGAGTAAPPAPVAEEEDPPAEEVEVTDLLLVVDLTDEVLVVDEHPRYHVAGCSWLGSRPTIPLPADEARADGFTACGVCRPDSTLADRERARKRSAGS